MAYQVIWAPSARLDLKELTSYIADSRPQAAARFVQRVFQVGSTWPVFPCPGGSFPNSAIRTSEKSFADLVGSCTE